MVFVKIKLNKTDVFGIDIPEELNIDQFNGVIERFQQVQKMLGKGYNRGLLNLDMNEEIHGSSVAEEKDNEDENITDDFEAIEKEANEIATASAELQRTAKSEIDATPSTSPPSTSPMFTREMMVRLLKAYWADTLDESERRVREIIRDYELPIKSRDDIKPLVFKAINKYNILPEEVDLVAFPSPGVSDTKYLRKKPN